MPPMTHNPDPVPLREALRGLRFFLRRGGETVVETLNTDALPAPAANLAGVVLREVDWLARSMDKIASGVAKTLLGGQDRPNAPLQDLVAQPGSDAVFAAAFYVALTTVLRRIGVPNVFVSEVAVRRAMTDTAARAPSESTEHYAARLTISLLGARPMRGASAHDAARVPGTALEDVCIFAVMLWIQSERSEAENESVLDAATDMSVALSAEVAAALADRNPDKIAALYARYVPHV